MEYKNIFSFNMKWNYKTISMFIVLIALPNLLGMINISTDWGFKLHFFQLAIIFAAVLYGPVGGMMAGVIGSTYSVVLMHNPYIFLFNAILGLMVGVFYKYGFNVLLATLFAFIVEIPILILVDHYVIGMPMKIIYLLLIALFVSNAIWATTVKYSKTYVKNLLE